MTRTDFEILVRQLNRKLYGFAFRILSRQEEAEDAVQEVFIKLWNMGDKLDTYNSIDALATTMIKNHCIDMVRKQKRSIEETFKGNESVFSTEMTPHEQMEQKESEEVIYTIIERLPGAFREIIIHKEIDGLSYEEIAEKTGQNVNTLRVSLSRARKLIRDDYNKYQYEQRRINQAARKVL